MSTRPDSEPPTTTSGLTAANHAGRIVIVVGAALGLYGGLRLGGSAPGPGEPIAWLPAGALLVGAIVFALGLRMAGEDRPAPSTDSSSGWRFERIDRRWLLAAGALGVVVAGVYALVGYHPLLLLGWLGSGAAASRAVWTARCPSDVRDRLARSDIVFLAGMLGLSAVLLLPYLADMPYEISTDEIYLALSVREVLDGSAGDPFGLVRWWGFPALHFAVVGVFAPLIGTSIEAMRLVSAVTALLVVVPAYVWIRASHGRTVARVAVALLVVSHAFVAWGRIGLHQISPVLLLAVATALIVIGLRDRCPLRILWGGLALGAGFYTYPSGQLSIFLWMATLLALLALRRLAPRTALRVAALVALGFALVVAPLFVTVLQEFEAVTQRARAVAISNPVVLESLGQVWGLEGGEVIRENLKRGLLAFNAPYPYVNYYNPGNALLDPIMGVLLWLGLATALTNLRHAGLLLATVAFFAAYVPNLFTEGAPVHGRLLIVFPFVAVLAAEALTRLVRVLTPSRSRGRRLRPVVLTGSIAGIALLNFGAYRDAVSWQLNTGRNDGVTAMGRSLGMSIEIDSPLKRFFGQAKAWDPRHHVLYITGEDQPLIRWGEPQDWRDWISFFADGGWVHEYEHIETFLAEAQNPFWAEITVFVPTSAADRTEALLLERYRDVRRHDIMPNRRLTAIKIQT